METEYAIIGSGPSGVNAALTLLERGKKVVMYDVGVDEVNPPYPEEDFYTLKEKLTNPYAYFLGGNGESIIPPLSNIGFKYPPSRKFYIKNNSEYDFINKCSTFKPIISFAKGGLGVAWGANAIEFNENDLAIMGYAKSDFLEAYHIMSKRLSIAGPQHDSLSDELKCSIALNRPLSLNRHEEILYRRSLAKHKMHDSNLNLGIARMAIETRDGHENACKYCARCIWGCGHGSIYSPLDTLKKCYSYSKFKYNKNTLVISLNTLDSKVTGLNIYNLLEKKYLTIKCDVVLLAAGAIGSGSIFLRTLSSDARFKTQIKPSGYSFASKSLLDTAVLKVPYIFPKLIGKKCQKETVQFNKLIVGYFRENHNMEHERYIHGEVVTLSSLLYHPLIEELPFGSKLSFSLFKYVRSAIGVVTYFLPDSRKESNHVILKQNKTSITGDDILLKYEEDNNQVKLKSELLRVTKKYLSKLGCYVPAGSMLNSPPGAGIHYAGTIPYEKSNDMLCTDMDGRTYAYNNLYAIDGSTFPSLPSKSITYNLIANSIRIATKI